MTEYFPCDRCGSEIPESQRDGIRRCCGIDGICDEQSAEQLIGKLVSGLSKVERRFLESITDERALPAITQAFRETAFENDSLAAAIASIASPQSEALMSTVARETSNNSVLLQAVRYLARVNTAQTRDVLAEVAEERQQLEAALALAEFGDERALQLLFDAFSRFEHAVLGPPSDLQQALREHAGQAGIDYLRTRIDHYAQTETRISEWLQNEQWVGYENRRKDQPHAARAIRENPELMLSPEGMQQLAQREKISCTTAELRVLAERRVATSIAFAESMIRSIEQQAEVTAETPTVPHPEVAGNTETVLSLRTVASDSQDPVTRFGSQPSWLATPTWPSFQDQPMQFWGQFRLPWDDTALAYLFIAAGKGYMCTTEDGSAALFVQPHQNLPTVPYTEMKEGPLLSSEEYFADEGYKPPLHSGISPRVATLEPLDRTPQAEGGTGHSEVDWNHVGGTAQWLQGNESPGPDWRFLFQFTASRMGHELGDAAECYGFVKDNGQGMFLWQCH